MIVDIEALTATFLREHDIRARNTPPDESHRDEPWVEITLLNGPSDDVIPVDWLIPFLVQFACYAGSQGGLPEAIELRDQVREVLATMRTTTLDDAVVTSVKFPSMTRVPDDHMEPARERYMLDARIHAHPKVGS